MSSPSRKIVIVVERILGKAGFDSAFSDADLRDLCRAVVGAYMVRVGESIANGEDVDVRQAELALKVMAATSGEVVERAAAADLASVSTAELMRFAQVGNRG